MAALVINAASQKLAMKDIAAALMNVIQLSLWRSASDASADH
ncbi:MAG: hypothetical protein AAGC76_10445 [Luteibacter sp.]|nr:MULTISPECIES: hypothetical protein [Rhodanobacteraceae]MDQ7996259.1 hypothetical protein [Luteibacter sp.]MDQ8049486.1 hypothetical protein [Luteibacter sp.]